jgi:hypothetical protein
VRYKKGDKVLINKLFSSEDGGKWVECDTKTVEIAEVETTPTYGVHYKLLDRGEFLCVWYFHDDIISKV